MGCDSLARSSMMTYMIVVRLPAARKLERQCDGGCFIVDTHNDGRDNVSGVCGVVSDEL
jgi:hypothetical protein